MTHKAQIRGAREARGCSRIEMSRGTKLVLLLSIPVYVFLTWLLAIWLPKYPIIASIPIVFAVHSTATLIRGVEP